MKLDMNRLHHLRQISRDRKAAYRAANDDRLDQREKILRLQRDRALMAQNYHPRDSEKALSDLDACIETAKVDLAAMTEREAELASASSTAGATFQRALEFAQAEGLDLPDDMQPKTYGAPARAKAGAN